MSDLAKLGFSVDTSGLKKGEKALNDFAKTGEQTEKRTDKSSKKIIDDMQGVEKAVGKTAAAQLKADKAMAQFSRRSGQAGIQFQQFIGQVQGGQGVMLALSQQSADLGFVLGAPLLGAIAGISASLIGLLIPNLIDTTTSMQDLDKAMEQVNKTATDTDGIKAFTKEIALIAEESEKAGRLMILAAKQSATEAGRAAAEGIGESFNDVFDVTVFQTSFDALKTIAGTAEGTGFSISQEYKDLGEQFGFTGSKAREAGVDILISLREMEQAVNSNLPDAGAKIIAFQEKLSDLAETSSGENKTKLLTFVNSISEYISKAKLATEMAELFDSALKETDLDLVTEETIKLDGAVEGVAQSLKAQIIALRDGEDAAINWSIAQRLGLDSVKDIPEAIQDQIDLIAKLRDEQSQTSALESLSQKLTLQAIKLHEGADAAEIYSLRLSLFSKNVAPEIVEAYVKILEAQQKLKKEQKKKGLAENDFDKLTKKIEGFGGAWTKTGSIIVDAFGDISDAMNNYMDQLGEIESNEKALAVFREKKGKDNVEVIALQQKLEDDRISAELSGLKSVAKVGQSLFEEKTAAAKAFSAIEKAITAAQIAMSLEKMLSSSVETAAVVANEGVKQAALATTAVVNQGSGDPYTAFARIAAMTALMATLVSSFSGGGGGNSDQTAQRQELQGTGTVLGSDDKSQSILESQERFEDLQIDQLAELRGIRDSLNNVASGIALVTRDLVASRGLGDFGGDLTGSRAGESSLGKIFSGEIFGLDFGGLGEKLISGIFGSTKKKVTDSGIQFIAQSLGEILEGGVVQASQFFDIEKTKKKLFGLSKKTSTSTEFQALDSSFGEGIGAIFKNIGDVVLQSAELLGFETVSILQSTLMGPLTEEDFAKFGRGIAGRFAQTFEMTEVSLEEALSRFQVNIGKVSLEGLSGEEVEKELQAIFSQQADLIAEFLVPSIAEYQQIGEGLFDTLTRVAREQVIFNSSIERMGFDLSELSNVMQIDVAQSIIALTGGVENFADLTGSFFENFFSESEQLVFLQDSLTEAFDSLGLSLVTSREEFKALVEGIDVTTEEGQALLAALLEINPALSDYIDELERVEAKRVDMTIELLRLQGKAEEALAMERQLELDALDESLRALQLLIFAEEDRIALIKEQEDAIRSSFSMLEQAVNLEKQRAQAALDIASTAHAAELDRIDDLRSALEAESALRQQAFLNSQNALIKSFDSVNRSIELEKERAKVILDSAKISLDDELSRIGNLRKALNEEKQLRESNVNEAEQALKSSFKSEIDSVRLLADERINLISESSGKEIRLIEENSNARIRSLENEKSALENTASSMSSLIENINSSLGLSGSTDLVSALDNARLGDFAKAQALDLGTLTNLEPSGFSSAEELAVQEAINRNRLKEISDLAGDQLTEAEAMISAIERQISSTETSSLNQIQSIENNSEAQINAINEQSEAEILELENQLNALLGIDTSVLSISEAINSLGEAQQALDELGYEEEQQRLDQLIVNAQDEFALHEQGYTDEIERLDAVISSNKDQLNALLGIDDSVLAIDDAINQFQDAQRAIDELGYEQEVERLDMLVDSANDVYALHEQAYADELERLDAILFDNEELLNAALGIETSVLSVVDAIAALEASILALADPSLDIEQSPLAGLLNPVSGGGIPDEPPRGVIVIDNPIPSPDQQELKEELIKAREDNAMFQRELIKNTKQTARILQRFELDGLDTRAIN